MKNTIFALLVIGSFSVAIAQEKSLNRTFKNIKDVKISAASGDIEIVKSKDGDTRVSLEHTYSESGYTPVISESDGKLTIEEKFERGNYHGTSHWTLEIPDNVRMRLTTGSGNISVEEVLANIKSNTGSGNVELTNARGDFDCNTGSGDVEVQGSEARLELNTGSGNVRLKSSKGSFHLNAGSGNVRLEQVTGDIVANTGSGDVDAKGVVLSGSSRFNTGSGDVSVILGSELKYDISVNSGSGNSTLEFNGNTMAGEFILTANERQGNIAAPFKFDREETIDQGRNSDKMIRKTAKIGNSDVVIKVGTGSGTARVVR